MNVWKINNKVELFTSSNTFVLGSNRTAVNHFREVFNDFSKGTEKLEKSLFEGMDFLSETNVAGQTVLRLVSRG